jgi:DNA-binding MarR family transcriptional regulator
MSRMTSSAQPDLGILLALAYQEFVRELRAAMAGEGFDDLGRSDGFVFRALSVQPLTASDLAARLMITKQGTAQIIDDMESRGYVSRRPDPADARARLVELTERGEAALACARRFHRRREDQLAGAHGRAALAEARSVLTALASAGTGADGTDGLDPQLRGLYL